MGFSAARRAIVTFVLLAASAGEADAGGLGGSPASMRLQHDVARENDYEFLDDARELRELVAAGRLEPLVGNADYRLARVSYPYAQPEVRLFVERVAAQFRAATGNELVVTSLTRPSSEQPRNAHKLSVHPAGMAVDFRIPKSAPERAWLERALLDLEKAGVLDVTRERSPAHYHVAVFPDEYKAWVRARDTASAKSVDKPVAVPALATAPVVSHPAASAASSHDGASGSRKPLAVLLAFGILALPAVVLHRRKGH